MSEFGSKSVLIVDDGSQQELARTLSLSFGKVFYFSPWVADFPSSYKTKIGEGFDEFERIDSIWDYVDETDLFVFPYINEGPLQEYLVKQGKRVWGSRNGDEIENFRVPSKELMASLGIPQAPYEVVTGITDLRKYLKSRGDDKVWIKISLTRQDTETFCIEGYERYKSRIDELEVKFGPVAEYREFIVEDHLPDTLDVAIDTYCIDGKFPSKSLLGNESKDQGYVSVVKEWNQFPPKLRSMYEKLAPELKKFGYRNFFALESRIGKDSINLSDPCCRVGSPVFELELNMMTNLPQILWEGAAGKMVEPEYKSKYGFEVLLKSDWAKTRPVLIEFPEKYRENIKLRYVTKYPDGIWYLPQAPDMDVIGAVVVHGNSLDDLIEEAEEIGCQIKGIQIDVCSGGVAELKKNLETLSEFGVQF